MTGRPRLPGVVVDADSHVMEPSDLWERNLEPRFRDRALRIRRDERGAEYVEVAGAKSKIMRGGWLGSFGALDDEVALRSGRADGDTSAEYEESVPAAARDMRARLAWMDDHGIDVAVVYPSLCLGWHNECDDALLAAAYCRVYNDWLTDACAVVAERVLPVAMVPLLDVAAGVAELHRACDLGARGLYLNPVPMNGISYGDEVYDPLWAACEERGIPVTLHVSNTPLHAGRRFVETSFEKNSWFMMMMYTTDCQIALTSMFAGGLFDRFPELSVGVVETGCGWVPHWLEWMDSRYELAGRDVLRHPPSEYFDRQCWVAGEPGERMFPAIAELVGAHKLLWASDYPHEEGHRDPVALLVDTLAGLDAEDRQRILGGNAAEIYGLGP